MTPAALLRADAAALLAAYQTDDPVEAGYLDRMRALCAVPANPFSRAHEVPGHFTASAFVLSPDEAQLLLIRHRKLRRWLQPGGHFEASDGSVDEATRREITEETGIEALVELGPGLFDVDIHKIPAHGSEPGHDHLDLRMAYRAQSWTLADTDEVDDVRWVALAEVANMETDASVLRAVARLLAR
ncbi:MAG: NUDIX hydrolase [Myxococcales bacterium]|nr:NUDIX hydrolase [Myxococcales bacterium]